MGLYIAHSQRNGMAVRGAHDVPDFRLAAGCKGDGFSAKFPPARTLCPADDTISNVAESTFSNSLRSILRGIRFAIFVLGNLRWELRPLATNVRHFVLTIMLNERLEADLFQHMPRSLFVDGEI